VGISVLLEFKYRDVARSPSEALVQARAKQIKRAPEVANWISRNPFRVQSQRKESAKLVLLRRVLNRAPILLCSARPTIAALPTLAVEAQIFCFGTRKRPALQGKCPAARTSS
jgi:hypothetical protein